MFLGGAEYVAENKQCLKFPELQYVSVVHASMFVHIRTRRYRYLACSYVCHCLTPALRVQSSVYLLSTAMSFASCLS